MNRSLRRVATSVAAVGMVMAGTLVSTAGAAQASGCHKPIPYLTFHNGVLGGHNWQFCYDPDSEIPWPVKIERYDDHVSPAQWVIVAQGDGDASYTCVGTTPHVFRLNGGRVSGTYACQ